MFSATHVRRLPASYASNETRLTASKQRGAMVPTTSEQSIDRIVRSSQPSTSISPLTALPTQGEPPAGTLTANADGSVTTPGGYTIINDGGHQWRIKEPSGVEHRIWGDPHVDENNDGTLDWNFNTDAAFILPDGTSIFCDTDKVGELNGKDVTTSTSLHIAFGQSLATMDVVTGGAAQLSTANGPPPQPTGPVSMYVLADGSHFVDAKTLGDLSDTDGDDAADVSATSFGTISAQAQAVLQMMSNGAPPPKP
jgi:hypothetical protein